MRPGEFVVVLSGIDPEDDVQTAKVYFRSSLYRDFYYVEMAYQEGRYVGILPQPSDETLKVIYYVEALDSSFNTARSPEYDAEVRGRCRQESAAAFFPGGDAGITVGATVSGGASIPPGFTAAGIVGTVSATGLVSGVGGGIGAGTAVAVGVAAAAAAGAGAAVLTAGGNEAMTSSVVAALPTSSVATTSTIPSGSTSSTTAPGPGPSSSTTTTVGGGGSTTTVDSTSTAPAALLDASCFTVAVLGKCKVRVDATCVALPVDRYEWILDLNSRWRKVEFPDGPVTVTHTWGAGECGGGGETIRFRLKVRRGDEISTAHKNLFVPGDGLRATPADALFLRLRTRLSLPGLSTGRVFVNTIPVRVIDNAAPVEMRARSRRGNNTLVAVVATASGQPGTWRFALDPIVPGSLRIVSGDILTQTPDSVVFRLAGHVGERVELTFVLRE